VAAYFIRSLLARACVCVRNETELGNAFPNSVHSTHWLANFWTAVYDWWAWTGSEVAQDRNKWLTVVSTTVNHDL
jgi:hypothetical protein